MINSNKIALFSGNIEEITENERDFITLFMDIPGLMDIFYFKKEPISEFWFVVDNYDRNTNLKYTKRAENYFKNSGKSRYEYLIIKDKQLIRDQMPLETFSFHLKLS